MYGIHRCSATSTLRKRLSITCRYLQTALEHQNTKTSLSKSNPVLPSKDSSSLLLNPKLQKLIRSNFPKAQLCFAYGSKVLYQLENLPDASTMTDLIFVVHDTKQWHRENFSKNKHHYSRFMRMIGPTGIAAFQNTKPYCFFNPFVEVDGVLLKYGVIAESHVLKDLQQWDTLYIAGRLHKPVLVLDVDKSFKTSYIDLNLRSALHTALVFLPDRFSDVQLFSVLSRISYFGDIRMYMNLENPNKVRNIVEPNVEHFKSLYERTIDESPFLERTDYGFCQAPKTEKNLYKMEGMLPPKLLHLPEGINPKSRVFRFDKNIDAKHQLFRKIAAGDSRYVEEQLRLIIMWPSIYQTFKGFLSAGVGKSWKYSAAKIRKSKGSTDKRDVVNYKSPAEGTLMSSDYQNYGYNSSNMDPANRTAFFTTWSLLVLFSIYFINKFDLWDKL